MSQTDPTRVPSCGFWKSILPLALTKYTSQTDLSTLCPIIYYHIKRNRRLNSHTKWDTREKENFLDTDKLNQLTQNRGVTIYEKLACYKTLLYECTIASHYRWKEGMNKIQEEKIWKKKYYLAFQGAGRHSKFTLLAFLTKNMAKKIVSIMMGWTLRLWNNYVMAFGINGN